MSSMKNIKKQKEREDMNIEDVSKFNVDHHHDWSSSEVSLEIFNLVIRIECS